jgi:NADH-quinone oxidoreductase subunit M
MPFPLLTAITFIPLLAGVLILLVPKSRTGLIKVIATAATGIVLALSIAMLMGFDHNNGAMQFSENLPWIPQVNINYHLGVDGISVGLIFLTALLGFLACVGSYGIKERQKEYYFLYLLLNTGMLGTFLSLDLFLFYVFWEVVLVPMYFLIGIWGGPRKESAD